MKDINFNEEARQKLTKGLDTLANAVKCTLGPKGRNVVIQNANGSPNITKDGVTVAKHVTLVDQVENLGAEIVKQAAKKTADLAGDGTTTSTVLAQALVHEGNRLITQGFNPIDIKRGYEEEMQKAIAYITNSATPVKDDWNRIDQVAMISANNDLKMGELISRTFKAVGPTGVITVENSNSSDTYAKKIDGLQLDRGWISPFFINDRATRSSVLENPLIFITDKKLRLDRDITNVLEIAAKANRPILIIADELEANALNIIVQNQVRGNITACAIKAPWHGKYRRQMLQDIATTTGGTMVCKEVGITPATATLEHLGSAKKIIVTNNDTTIIQGDANQEQVEKLKEDINLLLQDKHNSDFDNEKLRARYANVANQIAVIYVGASTEVELREKKDRIDDALHATRAALKEGIVPGGGQVFLDFNNQNQVNSTIALAFNTALQSPFNTIIQNAGKDPKDILFRLYTGESFANKGYDANHDAITNLVDSGIIDPAMVSRLAIENAVSVANAILMSESTVTYHIEPDLGFNGMELK